MTHTDPSREPIMVLLVEDSPGDAALIAEHIVADDFRPVGIEHVESLSGARKALEGGVFDLVLLDLGLPDSLGIETYSNLREMAPETPVIILTGRADSALAKECVLKGAQDYLVKGKVEAFLCSAIHNSVNRARLQRGLVDAHARLEHLNKVLRAIRNVNQLIVRETDPQKLIEEACRLLVEDRGYSSAWAIVGDVIEDGTLAAAAGGAASSAGFLSSLKDGLRPPCSAAFEEHGPSTVVRSPRTECADCRIGGSCGADFAIVAPVRHGSVLFGFLGVALPSIFSADEEERGLLFEVAGDIAFALHRSALEKSRSRSEEGRRLARNETRALAGAARDVRLGGAFERSARSIFDSLSKLLGAKSGYVALLSPDRSRNQLLFLESGGLPCTVDPSLEMPVRGLRARAYETGRPVYENDFRGSAHWDLMPQGHVNLDNVLFAPMMLDGSAAGLIGLSNKPGGFNEHDAEIASAFAEIAAIALRDARKDESLRKSEERFRNFFETAPDMCYMVSPEGLILDANSAACSSLGYAKDEMVGKSVADIYSPESMKKAIEVLAKFRETGHTANEELEVVAKDGRRRKILLSASSVRDSRGRIMHSISIQKDVTDKIRIEEQLAQSKKLEAIGSLAGGIAHDFNNLMTVVGGYCEMIRPELPRDALVQKRLDEVAKAGQRAAELTRQLLAFSRKQVMKPEILDLNAVSSHLMKMLERLIGENIEIVFVPGHSLHAVMADRTQVEQILLNLAVNARDAMPAGGKLTIETKNVEVDEESAINRADTAPGSYVMLAISDSGCGMSEEVRSRVFEPFFTTKGAGKGTGLGLSTVWGIVKQSGGNIYVYSEPGRGTTFRIYFPDAGEKEPTSAGKTRAAKPARGCEKILLVEDDTAVRKVAREMLEESGYKVTAASNGAEALQVCKTEGGPDLLLTDVVMPGMSGKELAAAVMKISPDTKVLFMSGYTDNAIHHHGVLEPGTAFIEKPLSQFSLTKKIREVLGSI